MSADDGRGQGRVLRAHRLGPNTVFALKELSSGEGISPNAPRCARMLLQVVNRKYLRRGLRKT